MPEEKKFVEFVDNNSEILTRRTKKFDVLSKANGSFLGQVYFRPQWRKYVFAPSQAVFDAVCLAQISGFIDALTDDWRSSIIARKSKPRRA